MKLAVLGAISFLALSSGACGDGDRTVCEVAKENLAQCNAEIAAANPFLSYQVLPLSIGDECSGQNACLAKCVKGTSCDAMSWVILGLGGRTDPEQVVPNDAGPFNGCIQKCID